jgi:tRNA G18 (ribose-2'-O)-methylase SpoU
MYVPARLVALIKRALRNGRRIEELLYQIGPALIRAHRQSRALMKSSKKRVTSTNSGNFKKKTKTES